MNVVFLDYDGVVNTPQWKYNDEYKRWVCNYSYPSLGTVNDFQAVQWVSEFCEKFDYKIVVSSTWRYHDNYIECLKKGGLREGVEVIGRTPRLVDSEHNRGDEISLWLESHDGEVENYLIFDDDQDMGPHMNHLIKCDPALGFTMNEFEAARRLHNIFQKGMTADESNG